MTTEDDEFTRIEMESKARMLAAQYALNKKAENARELGLNYEPSHIPLITDEEWDALNAEEK